MMAHILSTEDYELCRKLKTMRFSGMAEELVDLLQESNSDLIPFREKVGSLVDAEWDLRYNKKLNLFMKKATLRYPHSDLDETIYDPERMLNAKIIEHLRIWRCWTVSTKTPPGANRHPALCLYGVESPEVIIRHDPLCPPCSIPVWVNV